VNGALLILWELDPYGEDPDSTTGAATTKAREAASAATVKRCIVDEPTIEGGT
jgi:hypothetical protein